MNERLVIRAHGLVPCSPVQVHHRRKPLLDAVGDPRRHGHVGRLHRAIEELSHRLISDHGRHRTVPLPVLEHVHAVAHLHRIWHCDQRAVAQRTRTELLPAADHGDDRPVRPAARVPLPRGAPREELREVAHTAQGGEAPGAAGLGRALERGLVPQREAQVLQRLPRQRRRQGPQRAHGQPAVVRRRGGEHLQRGALGLRGGQLASRRGEPVLYQLVRDHVQRAAASHDDALDMDRLGDEGDSGLDDAHGEDVEHVLDAGGQVALGLHRATGRLQDDVGDCVVELLWEDLPLWVVGGVVLEELH
mmetsp:Transcript_63598/g.169007  ORF Transcript_63598/g.169007 Transcript_63598/m.169007 type:complete len:304 (+) Transcript_63598:310-1221(+)